MGNKMNNKEITVAGVLALCKAEAIVTNIEVLNINKTRSSLVVDFSKEDDVCVERGMCDNKYRVMFKTKQGKHTICSVICDVSRVSDIINVDNQKTLYIDKKLNWGLL